MERTATIEAEQHIGERVRLLGWLHNLRRHGAISFLVLRDGWGTIQAVFDDEQALEPLLAAGAANESIIELDGTVVAMPAAPGGIELHAPVVRVIVPVYEPTPVTLHKKEIRAGLSTILDHGSITNRHPQRRAVFRIAGGIMAGFRDHLRTRRFTEIQTPKLVASATESGANVFGLDYFEMRAFLAQSPQFYKQMMVGVFERVFEVGPVFRAEPHDTTRHTNEYVSLDVEMGFISDHFQVMALLEGLVAGILVHLQEAYPEELALLGAVSPRLPEHFPHLHILEAQQLIFEQHGLDVRGEPDLSPQDERLLGEWALAEHQSDFVFVTGYPLEKRPFYTHPDPHRPGYTNSFDLLFRGTELVTGGQRLHLYQDYLDALESRGLPVEPFAGYLEAFRYGMPPHGGFAIGLERFVMQLLNLPNLRLATLFPRDRKRLTP